MARFRIKQLAQERGWSTEDLARQSGLRVYTVRNLWQGKSEDPRFTTLKAIAGAFGVSIESLEILEEETEGSEQSSDQPGRRMPNLVTLGVSP